ncbi:class I SAM-dependent DNA methyltransferase, partial [Campylobacter coli]
DIEQYPALKQYLSQFLPRIEQSGEKGCRKKTSNKWFETQDNIAYYEEFEKEILVWKAVGRNLAFALTEKNTLVSAPSSFISADANLLKYFCGILLSHVLKWLILQISDTTGAGDLMLNNQSLERLSIPKINSKNEKIADELINLVDEILKAKEQDKNANTQELENKINSLVYKLYNLTEDEIKIIENKE